MKSSRWVISGLIVLGMLLAACGDRATEPDKALETHGAEAEPEKGPHGGRLLTDGDFALELAIFETGVPPEYRAWVTRQGRPVAPGDVALHVTLTRLGDRVDRVGFRPEGDYLRGDTVIAEPHSFVVDIEATYEGQTHRWHYHSFEGRTTISASVAEALGIATAVAGPAVLKETVTLFGRVKPNAERVRKIGARFDGVITAVQPSLGDTVRKGDALATVESNESLQRYTIDAPIAGVITQRDANPGELTAGRTLFTITNTSSVWVELPVFPADRARIRAGQPVTVNAASGGASADGRIASVTGTAAADQSVSARVVLDNSSGQWSPGDFVTAQVTVATHEVPLAVERAGLQAFRDFTVVYAQIGEQYEVRMLDLGRQDADRIEVLGGIEPGTRYVSENSYIVKADIEKSGAAHDH